jgi:3,4-dihydroxy 2-butanone 4-phosphate synthase/GTP cyclohydrolase II
MVAECALPTIYGDFELKAYHDAADDQLHFALVRGAVRADEPVLVRVHMEDRLYDMLGATFHETSWSLRAALERVAREPAGGIVVLLRGGEDARVLARRVMDHQLHDRGVELPKPPMSSELRTFGVGAQILADLGVRRMRVMGSPKRLFGLSGFGLEIVDYVPGNG